MLFGRHHASISTAVQSLVGASEREVTALGFNLLLAAVPLVVSVLWLAFIIRCAWFLRRLRGWKQDPAPTGLPKKFLRGRPRLRRVVVGLAHPGLLLVAGLGTSVLALLLGAVELTLNVSANRAAGRLPAASAGNVWRRREADRYGAASMLNHELQGWSAVTMTRTWLRWMPAVAVPAVIAAVYLQLFPRVPGTRCRRKLRSRCCL